MPAQDDVVAQIPELQDALRHAIQESGGAGTGPIRLPPPADFTSEQARSQSPSDPFSYSNTVHVDLYRDADGKIWTQPGPGHETSDLEMKIRKANGTWQVVTEVSHVVRRVRRKGRIHDTMQTDAISTSGAPSDYELPSDQGHGWDGTDKEGQPITPTEVRNRERFEDFSPRDPKTAMRQAITKLQQKGAIYAPDPPGPPANAANALFVAAAIIALAAGAAFAGVGPFATQATAAVGPTAATAVPTVVVPTITPPVKLTGSGSIAFALSGRYGTGPTITEYLCQNMFLSPATSGAPEEPAMGVRGILNGRTYTAFFTATRTNVIFENVSATPAVFGPAPSTFVLGQRAAGTVAVQTAPITSPTQSGTVTIDLTCTGAAAATAAAPAPVTLTTGPVTTPAPPVSPTGPSPWGPGLAALAVAALGAGLATKAGIGPLAPAGVVGMTAPQDRPTAPSCPELVAAERQIRKEIDEVRRSRWGTRRGDSEILALLDNLKLDLVKVQEALGRCRAGGPDIVPMLRVNHDYPKGLDYAGFILGVIEENAADREKAKEPKEGGFVATPPSAGPADAPDADNAKGRQPIE